MDILRGLSVSVYPVDRKKKRFITDVRKVTLPAKAFQRRGIAQPSFPFLSPPFAPAVAATYSQTDSH
jgi:hypothetical protein